MEALLKKKELPGVISARDEFEDVDLVFPLRTASFISETQHGFVRPYYLYHRDEEIRVTCSDIQRHPKQRYPYKIELQRYIVGRPNLLCLPLYPQQIDKSPHYQAGCEFSFLVSNIWVWCYNDRYPARIDIDCGMLSPSMPIKLGDVEKMLPYGIFLHKRYDTQRFHSVVKLSPSNLYMNRKNLIVEQAEAIRQQKKKMQN